LGALWVSGVRARKVFRIDLDGRATIVAAVLTRPFGLGFLPDGDLLVVLITQRLILKFGAEKQTIHADLANAAVGYLRDLGVASGNAYVPSFDSDAYGPDCSPDGKFGRLRIIRAFERVGYHMCAYENH
jgi:hypothetical protein